MTASPRKGNSVNLDLLRAVAVSCVFLSHLRNLVIDTSWGSLGRFGVIIFFVHTSTVLMGSLARLEPEHSTDSALILAFWIKRFFRIYPLAIATVLVVAAFHVPSDPNLTYSWIGLKAFLSNLALIQNLDGVPNILSPLWSLPLEVQMYILLPFAFMAIRGHRHFRSLPLWVISVLMAAYIPRLNWRLEIFRYSPCFVSGIVAYDLRRIGFWKWKLPHWLWPLAILLAVAIFRPDDNLNLGSKMNRAWAVSLLLGISYAFTGDGPRNWMHTICHWIAERSYGIYLSHIIVFWLVFREMAFLPWWIRVFIFVVGSGGIPAVAYIALEKPLILVGNQITQRLLHTRPAEALEAPKEPALR